MDLIATHYTIGKILPKTRNSNVQNDVRKDGQSSEMYHDSPNDSSNDSPTVVVVKNSDVNTGFSFFLSILIGFFAVYLSWRCNTASDMHTMEKVIWAFLSFIFSIPFLIYYMLIRSHECVPIISEYNKRMKARM
jgi:hypothetical protein